MPKYLIQGNYTISGVQGLLKEGGSKRREAANQLVESLGGTMEVFYFAFGSDDLVIIADFPDSASAVAASLAAGAAGGTELKTTVLITPGEMDQATRKTSYYRAPGA